MKRKSRTQLFIHKQCKYKDSLLLGIKFFQREQDFSREILNKWIARENELDVISLVAKEELEVDSLIEKTYNYLANLLDFLIN